LLLQIIILAAGLSLEGRLAYLQIFKHAEYRDLAYRQQYTPKETKPSRGVIEDRTGALLAVNIGLFNVAAHPDQIQDKASTALVLSRVLGIPYDSILSKISVNKSFVWVARQIPFERTQAVESLKLEGIEASLEQRRFYPDHDMAAHVLGFAGIDNQGLDGLESYYNNSLSGKKGLVKTERDARGRVILADNKVVKANVDGLSVETTIDKTIQHIAQVELQKAYEKYRCKAASVAVMDPHTGEILALANCPDFDPNHFSLAPKESWKDRVVSEEFEPGSTFKLIPAVGALEEGVANEDDKFFCENGSYHTAYGRVVTDHEKFGWLTFREIFGYSSNIGMVKVSAKLGKENLYSYAKKFGIGDLTGIDLPGEAPGKLRPLDKWSGLSLSTIPYGYEISTTPIQMLTAYSAIANGGIMMKPHLVKALVDSDGRVVKAFQPKKIRRVCSPKTAKRMTEMMKWVVEKGTGTAVSLSSYPIAGKTGTAYKYMHGRYSKYNYVSSFIGFVPADNPRFAIYVSLDDPRGIYWGGFTAGPVFKEVAKRILVYDLVPGVDQTPVSDLADNPHCVPSFKGMTRQQCKWLAQRGGFQIKFEGKGERVKTQSEPAGTFLSEDRNNPSKLLLTLGQTLDTPLVGDAKKVMPDVKGKTKRQVLALLAPLGVQVDFKGEGVVHNQFPAAGRLILNNTPCELGCDLPVANTVSDDSGGHS
jgi:cell division protein FtsI/penicillin-binding protein 2